MDELDQLHGLALAADVEALPPQVEAPALDASGQPMPPPPDFANEAAGAVDMFSALIVGWFPPAETIWTTETKGRIAGALAPVMEKYGFTFGAAPPELLLLIMAGPPLWQSSRLIAEQINAEKAKKAEQAPPPPANLGAPPESGETPGPAMHPQMALYRK